MPKLSIAEVEWTAGTYYQDPDTKHLYVHATDSRHPDGHALTIAVINGCGILLTPPSGSKTVHDVVIDGLSFRGYQSREPPQGRGSRARWGVHVYMAERITVRHCASLLNMGGIFLLLAKDSIVEHCYISGNYGRYQTVGNNLFAWGGLTNTFYRNNVVENHALTFYGGKGMTNNHILNNLVINRRMIDEGGRHGAEFRGPPEL